MSKFLNYLKQNRIPIPIGLGLVINKIPYGLRPGLGKAYNAQTKSIGGFKAFTQEEKESYIFRNFKKVFDHSIINIPFYKEFYKSSGINKNDVNTFNDILNVPLISKDILKDIPLEDRSFPIKNRLLVNTGGSSGTPFSFYMDPGRYGNEWAHVHDMWAKYDYNPSLLKLSFDGRVKTKEGRITYDFARNSILYDIYGNPEKLSHQLKKILSKHEIQFLHGYPSAIYEFALFCQNRDPKLLKQLQKSLKVAFLSSEYPSPHYRDKIESIFQIDTQSFYGHTETAVMAVEENKFLYDVYQTYGYAESIRVNNEDHLIGTSYFNFASPLIRYDTGDLIQVEEVLGNKILSKFSIKEGRTGEFILDKNGLKIPLTGLIYGRHHQLFNYCEHIQVFQNENGKATIFYVPNKDSKIENAEKYFDSKGIDVDFNFIQGNKPILTTSGKANLLIKKLTQSEL